MSWTKLKLLGCVPSPCRQVYAPLPTRCPACLQARWVCCVTCRVELSLQNRTLASLATLQRWLCVSRNSVVQCLARSRSHHLFLFCPSEKQSTHMVASLEDSWQIPSLQPVAPNNSQVHGKAASTLLQELVEKTGSQAALRIRISGREPRNLYFNELLRWLYTSKFRKHFGV